MQTIDIDRGSEKKLGIAWGSLGISDSGRTGRTYSLQSQPILFGQSPAEFLPSLLSGGNFQRVLPFAAQVNALISENKARVLSEPSLVVLDGNSGSLLVGGEIPIPVAQTNTGSGGATLTVEYKQFGVLLNVTATITHDGLIQMTATPEVSDLDYSDAVQFNGFTIPALSVRRATSTLQMRDGETLVISGLYSNQSSRQVQRIPLLSQIPFIGEFFKTTSTKKTESELLILLTPQIVQPGMAATQPPPQGSPENLPLIKPDVRARDFDRDFPDLDGRKDRATGRAGHP